MHSAAAPSRPPPGPAALPVRGTLITGFLTLALLACFLAGWGSLARIDGAIIVRGQVEPAEERHSLAHPQGGIVSGVWVREGQKVREGALLLRLSDSQLEAERTAVSLRLAEALARKARLEAERDGAPAPRYTDPFLSRTDLPGLGDVRQLQSQLFAARAEAADRTARQTRLQISRLVSRQQTLARQIAAAGQMLALQHEDLARAESLSDRHLATSQAAQLLRREIAASQASLAQLSGALDEARSAQAELQLALDALIPERKASALAELAQLEPELATLGQQLTALDSRRAGLELRAPVAGTVHGLRISAPGTVLRAAEPVLTLIPGGPDLVILVHIPALSIDRVQIGQPVRLRLPGLPPALAPELRAEVAVISADTFQTEGQGPLYRAELHLTAGSMAQLEQGQGLKPGMPVEAFLLTAPRPPLAYLTGPVRDYFSRALRSG